jgi:LysM repeat protein
MTARRWLLFLVLNVVVSVMATLGVLSLRGELERVVVVTATPGDSSVEPVPTAIPADQVLAPSPTPTTSSRVEHTVQAGDTLGVIALEYEVSLEDLLAANNLTENAIIQPGQVLFIPQGPVLTPTPVPPTSIPPTPTSTTPTPFPTETPTPPGPVEVRIQELLAPGELAREGVVLVNRGRTVNLQRWTLGAAGEDAVYVFPRLTLAQEVPITVYTINGDDSPQALYWGQATAQWGESGVVIELRDAEGDLIATYSVP